MRTAWSGNCRHRRRVRRRARRAHLAQQLEPALSRQAKVEHDQIERTARDNRLGRPGPGRQLDRKVLLDETLLDRVGQPGLILDQQYPQCVHTLRCWHAAAPKKSGLTYKMASD